MIYVQHLLGLGHLARAARIAKAAAAGTFETVLVMGGELPPALDVGSAAILALPPVRAEEGGFTRLVRPDGTLFDAADQADRRDRLLAAFDDLAPDVLLVEAFPFGRRQMRFELLPLLERARARPAPPLTASSVRDILQRDRRPERAEETVAAIERFFDLVLVHGDPALVRLEASFPAAARFADKIRYTGLVAPPAPQRRESDGPAVVVSVGGGAVGGPVLEAALAARSMTRLADRPWLFLTGPNLPDATVARVAGTPGVAVERYVPDLAAVLMEADVSVSQAGYNTVADLLVTRCRAVLIPFASGGETEQGDRAALLAAAGLAVVVDEAALSAATLAAAIDQALTLPRSEAPFLLDGAAETVRRLHEHLPRAARFANPP